MPGQQKTVVEVQSLAAKAQAHLSCPSYEHVQSAPVQSAPQVCWSTVQLTEHVLPPGPWVPPPVQ